MRWNNHSELEGRHAFLSASQYHWIRYDDEKIRTKLETHRLSIKGSELHAYADTAIRLRRKQVKNGQTLNMYINDCIGYNMHTEQILFFSPNAFGTCDAIGYSKNEQFGKFVLRIFDLKTGANKASFDQLLIYVVYFCLEYDVNPADIVIILRLYQNDAVLEMNSFDDDILPLVEAIKERLISADNIINEAYMEEMS